MNTRGEILRVISKPWDEERILELNDSYCIKILVICAGKRLSLQYHARKLETLYLLKGKIDIELNEETWRFFPSQFVTIPPGTNHRITAIIDSHILETSTPELDDVIRVSDDYGRI